MMCFGLACQTLLIWHVFFAQVGMVVEPCQLGKACLMLGGSHQIGYPSFVAPMACMDWKQALVPEMGGESWYAQA